MAFVVRTAKTLRNNWKKSVFFGGLAAWGLSYARERSRTNELMRVYCEEAARYGRQTIGMNSAPRTVTVILNPAANKRKATDEFEKYCAPILHVAGITVDVIKTEKEGHGRDLIDGLSSTGAVVVAGGDGTVSEVITGLLRRTQEKTNGLVPVGVLPLGKTNTLARLLFSPGEHHKRVRILADASMAVVEEAVRPINVMRVDILEREDNRPIYAASGIKWGAYRDAELRKDSYWVYGGLRKYATYLFNGYKSGLNWKCEADVCFTPPCGGCSNCVQQPPKRWFHRFSAAQQVDYSHISNPECQAVKEEAVSTVDLNVTVPDTANGETPKVRLEVGPRRVDYLSFVEEGWKSERGEKRSVERVIEARSAEIRPKVKSVAPASAAAPAAKGLSFSIDNETYEVKPMRVTVLPNIINVYCKQDSVDK